MTARHRERSRCMTHLPKFSFMDLGHRPFDLWTIASHERPSSVRAMVLTQEFRRTPRKPGNESMKKILHVSCSPRGHAAESYRLSQKIIGFLLQQEPTAIVVDQGDR